MDRKRGRRREGSNPLRDKALEMAVTLTADQRVKYLERELRDARRRHRNLEQRVAEHADYIKQIKHAVRAARKHAAKRHIEKAQEPKEATA